MGVVLVTGGTGTFGSKLVPVLAERGHEVRVLSRRAGAGTHTGNLTTGAGVIQAAQGADLVVHAASDTRSARGIGRHDPEQTRQLLAAISGVRHLLYISIVGIDAIPYGYYKSKLACEGLIQASGVPYTILRSTQFHELIAMVLRYATKPPVTLLPLNLVFQSVAAAEAASRAAYLLDAEPAGLAPDFGGPEILTARQMLDEWRAQRGGPRVVANLRWRGSTYRGFVQGRNTCPDHRDGRLTWAQYLRAGPADAAGQPSGEDRAR